MVVEIKIKPEKLQELEKIKKYLGLDSNVELVRTGLALVIMMYRCKIDKQNLLISEEGSVASFFEDHLNIEEIIKIGKGQ